MSDREEFCRLSAAPGSNVRELCRRWRISLSTGYKWLGRYRLSGMAGLADRSRRPLHSPRRSVAAIEAAVLALRRQHPAWGGRKLHRVLEMDGSGTAPAASAITEILRRHGLLDGPGAGEGRDWVRFEHATPNDLWQMDFKGHVAMTSGRCHPLTVLDDHSRFALGIAACADERTETVRARLEQMFRRYGLPRRMLTDNGSPWGTAGEPMGYTPLSVWLLDLGVAVSHGRPYHPQTQGKDERFHRSLKAEVLANAPLVDLPQAQRAFDRWREVYNTRRPHEALAMATPASRCSMSPRTLPETIRPPDYPSQAIVRTVDKHGQITLNQRIIQCPEPSPEGASLSSPRPTTAFSTSAIATSSSSSSTSRITRHERPPCLRTAVRYLSGPYTPGGSRAEPCWGPTTRRLRGVGQRPGLPTSARRRRSRRSRCGRRRSPCGCR
jgi:transposase InsO family protein